MTLQPPRKRKANTWSLSAPTQQAKSSTNHSGYAKTATGKLVRFAQQPPPSAQPSSAHSQSSQQDSHPHGAPHAPPAPATHATLWPPGVTPGHPTPPFTAPLRPPPHPPSAVTHAPTRLQQQRPQQPQCAHPHTSKPPVSDSTPSQHPSHAPAKRALPQQAASSHPPQPELAKRTRLDSQQVPPPEHAHTSTSSHPAVPLNQQGHTATRQCAGRQPPLPPSQPPQQQHQHHQQQQQQQVLPATSHTHQGATHARFAAAPQAGGRRPRVWQRSPAPTPPTSSTNCVPIQQHNHQPQHHHHHHHQQQQPLAPQHQSTTPAQHTHSNQPHRAHTPAQSVHQHSHPVLPPPPYMRSKGHQLLRAPTSTTSISHNSNASAAPQGLAQGAAGSAGGLACSSSHAHLVQPPAHPPSESPAQLHAAAHSGAVTAAAAAPSHLHGQPAVQSPSTRRSYPTGSKGARLVYRQLNRNKLVRALPLKHSTLSTPTHTTSMPLHSNRAQRSAVSGNTAAKGPRKWVRAELANQGAHTHAPITAAAQNHMSQGGASGVGAGGQPATPRARVCGSKVGLGLGVGRGAGVCLKPTKWVRVSPNSGATTKAGYGPGGGGTAQAGAAVIVGVGARGVRGVSSVAQAGGSRVQGRGGMQKPRQRVQRAAHKQLVRVNGKLCHVVKSKSGMAWKLQDASTQPDSSAVRAATTTNGPSPVRARVAPKHAASAARPRTFSLTLAKAGASGNSWRRTPALLPSSQLQQTQTPLSQRPHQQQTSYTRARAPLQKYMQRARARAQSKKPGAAGAKPGPRFCTTYCKTGKCQDRTRGLCTRIHDPSKVAVCPSWLQGSCRLGQSCPLQHKVCPDLMPLCSFYLQGMCTNEACPYLHVKYAPGTPVCQAFLRGCCPMGSLCPHQHLTKKMAKELAQQQQQ